MMKTFYDAFRESDGDKTSSSDSTDSSSAQDFSSSDDNVMRSRRFGTSMEIKRQKINTIRKQLRKTQK